MLRSMPLTIARRVRELQPSVTVAFMNRAKDMQRKGIDVLAFAAGEPDFDTPQPIKKAAIDALNAGQTKYMPTLGDPETRAALAKKLTEENGLPGVTADHIAISAGGKHSLYVACHCLLDQARAGETQEEVLLPVLAVVDLLGEFGQGKLRLHRLPPRLAFKTATPYLLRHPGRPRKGENYVFRRPARSR